MAERRMFAKTIIDSDAFLDMPLSSQALYFHLSMRADDDGFINNPNKISRSITATKNDMDLLLAKNFIIPFETGVCVIKHWLIHNYIQKDRYKPTNYLEEKALLDIKDNKAYTLNNECIQNGYRLDTQVRLGKSKCKDSIDYNTLINSLWNDFYNLYPKKVDKKKAYQSYIKQFKGLKTEESITEKADLILSGLNRYIEYWGKSKTEQQYIPYPTTWLNGEKWNDELSCNSQGGRVYEE